MTSRMRRVLLLALGPALYVYDRAASKLVFTLEEPSRAANPNSILEQKVVQPRYTAMKARTRR